MVFKTIYYPGFFVFSFDVHLLLLFETETNIVLANVQLTEMYLPLESFWGCVLFVSFFCSVKILFQFYLGMWAHIHLSVGASRVQKRESNPLKLML